MCVCMCMFTCGHKNVRGCVCCPVLAAVASAVMLWLLSLQTDSPYIAALSPHTPMRQKHVNKEMNKAHVHSINTDDQLPQF